MKESASKSSVLLELEDRVNCLTHAVGTGIALSCLAFLVVWSAMSGDVWKIVSVCIYGFTQLLLFVSSMLYHSARDPELRRKLRILDHVSINLLIAGTYTPFLLVNLRGPWGWSLFGAIWGLALIGVVTDVFLTRRFKLLATIVYLLMGWIILVALKPLVDHLSVLGIALLFSGGGTYSFGALFYLLDKKIPFGHAIWHLFVLCGSLCMFLAVVLGVIPYQI